MSHAKPSSSFKATWFVGDTHFGHVGILTHCASTRPFRDSRQMDRALIDNWNACVRPHDDVFHVGDFSFLQPPETESVLKRLNGNITLILGNHDGNIRDNDSLKGHFVKCVDYLEVTVEKQRIVLCHYPLLTWAGIGKGAWMLHGHCHGNLQLPFQAGKLMDVGVDCHAMAPVSFREVQKLMEKRPVVALDYHGRKPGDTAEL